MKKLAGALNRATGVSELVFDNTTGNCTIKFYDERLEPNIIDFISDDGELLIDFLNNA
ncbi:hypothetical protein [Pedobacter sp. Hv1]|uniref:hypothetical protein n=1 Tax=Pedobacter sp. Hv1 TaxID=1740090 RepID=UPI000A612FC5|nr:hypothetical protein [Pedobacter sp. Hv1]